jgi:hypothetical protein
MATWDLSTILVLYVSYLWVGVEGWHDGGVVVVDLHPIMSHG